jgi:protein gp37
MKQVWVDELRSQCIDQDIAFFFKQWGGVNKKVTGRIYRGRTWDEFPDMKHSI